MSFCQCFAANTFFVIARSKWSAFAVTECGVSAISASQKLVLAFGRNFIMNAEPNTSGSLQLFTLSLIWILSARSFRTLAGVSNGDPQGPLSSLFFFSHVSLLGHTRLKCLTSCSPYTILSIFLTDDCTNKTLKTLPNSTGHKS